MANQHYFSKEEMDQLEDRQFQNASQSYPIQRNLMTHDMYMNVPAHSFDQSQSADFQNALQAGRFVSQSFDSFDQDTFGPLINAELDHVRFGSGLSIPQENAAKLTDDQLTRQSSFPIFQANVNQAAMYNFQHPQLPTTNVPSNITQASSSMFQDSKTGVMLSENFQDFAISSFPEPNAMNDPRFAPVASVPDASTNDRSSRSRLEQNMQQPTLPQDDSFQLTDRGSGSPGEDSQRTASAAEEAWTTPESSAGSLPAHYLKPMYGQDSRRPSATEELARDVALVEMGPSLGQDASDDWLHEHGPQIRKSSFKRPQAPRIPKGLSERRNQNRPSGLILQRPNPMARAVSSSVVTQTHDGSFPEAPLAHLRHSKSAILGPRTTGGHISKARHHSNRGSPRLANFPNSAFQSAQATPQPPTAIPTYDQQVSPPPQQQLPQVQHDNPPTSASTVGLTPGLATGSMSGHSYSDTPITTPSHYHHDVPQMSFRYPPASDVPQSAPAHMVSFGVNDMSPRHGIPSMPVTPATPYHPQFVQQQQQQQHTQQQQMRMYLNGSGMFQPQTHVVPSQHGNPGPGPGPYMQQQQQQQGFIPGAGQPFGPQAHMFGMSNGFHDPYAVEAAWAASQSASGPPLNPNFEIHLDPNVHKLASGLKERKVTLLPRGPSIHRTSPFQTNSTVEMLRAEYAAKNT